MPLHRCVVPLLLVSGSAGCARAELLYEQSLPATDVVEVFSDIERGSLVYSGSNPDTFDLGVRVFSRGITRGVAEKRLEQAAWGVAIEGDQLDLWGRSRAEGVGVDFTVEGPLEIDIEAILLEGEVLLQDLTGSQIVTADRIVGTGLVGDLDLLATADGMEIEAWPEPGALLVLESTGRTTLALPYGLEYDLEVFSDPDWGVEVTDLGFDRLDASPDYVRAVTGSGGIRVEVTVRGGAFSLWNNDTEP